MKVFLLHLDWYPFLTSGQWLELACSINRSTYRLQQLRLISQAYVPTVTLNPVCQLAKLKGHIKINCERKRHTGSAWKLNFP